MRTLKIPLQIVLYKEDGDWIAHCLNFDVAGDGDTVDYALKNLEEAIRIQVEESFQSKTLENLFSPADSRFWRMFAEGKDRAIGELELEIKERPIIIESIEAREYSDDDLVLA